MILHYRQLTSLKRHIVEAYCGVERMFLRSFCTIFATTTVDMVLSVFGWHSIMDVVGKRFGVKFFPSQCNLL